MRSQCYEASTLVSLVLRSELLSSLGFRHGFSLRVGGLSTGPYASLNLARNLGEAPELVAHNHALLAREVGYAPERLYELSQVHGAKVEQVDPQIAPAQFRAREADALISRCAGCAVGVRVADCAPVLLADPASGAVAAVHAGWRGVVANVVEAAVAALAELSAARSESLAAAIFPCIGPTAFEVGEEVARQIAEAVGDVSVLRAERGSGALAAAAGDQRAEPARDAGAGFAALGARPRVDLALAVRLQLERAGLARARIERVAGCTFEDPARFYSFRRERGLTGRHLAVIVPRC